jgi:ankyrin repeat protein
MSNTNTSLHLAVQNGNIEIVRMLLDAGHDLNTVNADDITPLQLAIQLGHTEIVALLSENNKENRSVSPPPHTSDERNSTMLKFTKDKIFDQPYIVPRSWDEWFNQTWAGCFIWFLLLLLVCGLIRATIKSFFAG